MAQIMDFDGEPAHVLRDAGGAAAWVLPGVGANCIAFQTPVAGRAAHLISSPPSLDVLRARPTYWGFPILSPYPGRHQTPFTWRGTQYPIAPNDRPGVAIHGIVAGAPWEVTAATDDGVTCRFDSERFPDRATRWPWPFTLTATHRLQHGALRLELALTNRADEEIPHLLGLHPYFPVRFTPSAPPAGVEARLPTAAALAGDQAAAARRSCEVWVAGDELWEMKAGLGTGVIQRMEGAWDLRHPTPVAELEATLAPPPAVRGQAGQAIFGNDAAARGPQLPVLLFGKRAALRSVDAGTDPTEAGGVYSGIRDVASGVELLLESSAGFGSLALFCPPGEPRISLEPRSAVSDALTLMHNPRLSTGVWPLAPGATWSAWARISAKAIPEGGRAR